ncbi:integrase, partial [Plantactinospora sp. KLBMP9567]|nr:integrase [Plantactinospora sp. KLBMP9567]
MVTLSYVTWRHARRLAAQAGRDDTNETAVARVLDELLTRAQAGPVLDKASARVAARTRVAAAAHRPPPVEESEAQADEDDELDGQTSTTVVPMG